MPGEGEDGFHQKIVSGVEASLVAGTMTEQGFNALIDLAHAFQAKIGCTIASGLGQGQSFFLIKVSGVQSFRQSMKHDIWLSRP